MKIWKKLTLLSLSFLVICSAALMTVAGCGKEKDWNKIELNEVTHSIFYAPLYAAINEGYFKDEGLTVSLKNGGGSNTSMTALLTGSADIILAGPETVVYTSQEGISDAPVVFGQLTTCDGSFIVSKEANDNFTLDNLKGETIIGGRRGGLPAMTLEYIIKQHGLTIGTGPDEVNLRTDVEFNLTASTWETTASVKYCTLFEPTATNVAKEANGHIVASLGKLSGKVPYTCFAARQSYLKNHGDVAEKFLKAVLKGYDFVVNGDLDKVAKSLMKSFDGATLEDMKTSVIQYKAIEAWSDDMILTEASFQNLMNIMLDAKVITQKSNWSDIVDNTIATSLKVVA